MSDSKNNDLQVLRGIAALTVFNAHLIEHLPRVEKKYLHLVSFFGNWGTEAVMVFFILSGLVIHMSFDKHPVLKWDFIKNRIIRIHPTLVIAVIAAMTVNMYLYNGKFHFDQFLANLIPVTTLHAYISELYWDTNPVIWTLTFEVFFYFFFALFCIRKKEIDQKFISGWFLLGLVSIFLKHRFSFDNPYINQILLLMSFSCIWIVGFWIWHYRRIFYTDINLAVLAAFSLPMVSRLHILPYYHDPLRYLIFAVMSWPLFQYLLYRRNSESRGNNRIAFMLIPAIYILSAYYLWTDKGYLLVVKLLYILLPLAMLLVFKLFKDYIRYVYDKLMPPLYYLGQISYSVYLLHFPILVLTTSILPIDPVLKILIIVVIVGTVSHYVEFKFQPFIKRLFNQ